MLINLHVRPVIVYHSRKQLYRRSSHWIGRSTEIEINIQRRKISSSSAFVRPTFKVLVMYPALLDDVLLSLRGRFIYEYQACTIIKQAIMLNLHNNN